MSAFFLTPLAKADIFQIWCYIARHNEDAADEVERAIDHACQFLADSPLLGHSKPGFSPRKVRFWTLTRYPNYLIAYRPEQSPLEILAVFHGRRNIGAVVRSRLV